MTAHDKRFEQMSVDNRRGAGRCHTCALKAICLPVGLGEGELLQLEQLVSRRAPLQPGEVLVRAGERFRAIFAVRAGCLKSHRVRADGSSCVYAFHLPGQLAGLESIYPGVYQGDIVALGTAGVCELPFERLHELSGHVPSLQWRFTHLLSRELYQLYQLMAGDRRAKERVGAFLLEIGQRFRERGCAEGEFVLPMPRKDIAAYLNIAHETVSRAFTELQRDGLIEVHGRHVVLRDHCALARLAGACE